MIKLDNNSIVEYMQAVTAEIKTISPANKLFKLDGDAGLHLSAIILRSSRLHTSVGLELYLVDHDELAELVTEYGVVK